MKRRRQIEALLGGRKKAGKLFLREKYWINVKEAGSVDWNYQSIIKMEEEKKTPGAFSSSEDTTSDFSATEKEARTLFSDEELEHWLAKRKARKPKRAPLSPEEKEVRRAKKDLKMKEKRDRFKAIVAELKKRPYYDEETDKTNARKYYSAIDPAEPPDYDTLHQLVSGTYKHAKRRENIFPVIDRQPDYTLRCVYTGEKLEDEEGNLLVRCDEEHAFPQSYQSGCKKGTGRDMHQIFAASKNANGSRGNKPFGPGPKLIRDDPRGQVYTLPGGRKSYVPKKNAGAACRATLYVLLAYEKCADPAKFPPGQLAWIVEQATSTDVSLWERHRNAELHRLQGNRNPFIDHPEWALHIDFKRGF